MKDGKNKQTTILIVIASVLFISLIGISFAYYFTMLRGQNENVISTGRVTINYEEQNTPLTVNKILSEKEGIEQTDYYEFKISSEMSSSSYSGTDASYFVYLEEMEGNTIDPKYISFYLTDENDFPYSDYYHDEYYDYETGDKIDYSTYRAGIEATKEVTTTTLEDGREEVQTDIFFFVNNVCHVESSQTIDGVGSGHGGGPVADEFASKCRYGYEKVGDAYNLNGSYVRDNLGGLKIHAIAFSNLLDNFKQNGGKEGNIIHFDITSNTYQGPDEKIYRLRTWISEDYTPTASSETGGETNDSVEVTPTTEGTSQTADFATDGIFKFKINVYAEPYIFGNN